MPSGQGLPKSNQPPEADISHATETAAPIDRRAVPPGAGESLWHAGDGQAIRRLDLAAPDAPPRGSILFLPGRGDFYEKYLETLDHWRGRGYAVSAADWRGQAGSGRFGTDAVTGHIGDFALWIDDLAALWAAWTTENPAPHFLAAHSMGGHLALRALAEDRVDPAGAILSAPMLGFTATGLPLSVMHGAARLMARLGDPRRLAWKWSEKPGEVPALRVKLLTHDADRYADELWWREYRPELVMGPGSWGWVERGYASIRLLERRGVLERITTPIVIVATTADRLVDYGAIRRAASRLPHAELVTFGDEAAHELLRETDPVRDRALAAIDALLDRIAPAR